MASDAHPVAGVLLAGGLSRRMGGGDKNLRLLGGRPVLAHVIERVRPQVAALALNANGDPKRFADYGLPVVADTVEGFAGPLAGVLAGLDWAGEAAPRCAWLLSAPTDAPFLPIRSIAIVPIVISPCGLSPSFSARVERHFDARNERVTAAIVAVTACAWPRSPVCTRPRLPRDANENFVKESWRAQWLSRRRHFR